MIHAVLYLWYLYLWWVQTWRLTTRSWVSLSPLRMRWPVLLFSAFALHHLIILRFLCGLGGVVVSPQAHRLTFHICSASGSGSVSPP